MTRFQTQAGNADAGTNGNHFSQSPEAKVGKEYAGTQARLARQAFIDAETKKEYGIYVVAAKYGTTVYVIEAWVDLRGWSDLYKICPLGTKWADMEPEARRMTKALNKLDRAFIAARSDD